MRNQSEIATLFNEARKCKRCFGDTPIYVPYPDPKNSQDGAELMFVNERPGRVGAGESGYVSFDNDDPSANFFKECFKQLGISRKNVFITNACLCHPLSPGYVDKKPTVREIRNCHFWLEKQLEIVQPKLIITIGGVALDALKRYFSHSQKLQMFRLQDNIGEYIDDTEPWIYPLYHTSLRARTTRKAYEQKRDWQKIPTILKQLQRR